MTTTKSELPKPMGSRGLSAAPGPEAPGVFAFYLRGPNAARLRPSLAAVRIEPWKPFDCL